MPLPNQPARPEGRLRPFAVLLVVAWGCVPLLAAEEGKKPDQDKAILTVDRIFDSKELDPETFSAQWLEDGAGYTTLEDSKDKSGGKDIVQVDPRTGKREVLVPAALLVPAGESAPLRIEGYSLSKDRSLVLIYTNTKRVWRQNTRGDYWVLDRAARVLHKLAPDANPSTLMFAKLSPTEPLAAYVRERNIYVEDLRDGKITALTTSGSERIINGTFDWVYEEELSLRDGFRWSPDGRRIAYWQIDTAGVRDFPLVRNTGALYPKVVEFEYPTVGQRNSACRVGVVSVRGGDTRWLDVPGNPREHYIARMDWAESSKEIILQQLNRRQNTNRVMLADAETGQVTPILTEKDDAWIDVHDELYWLADGKRFTWISDRDGWRHVYLVSRDGKKTQQVTSGEFDVIKLLAADEKRRWLYFVASPENPTQRYLYRVRFDGSGMERVTPEKEMGSHDYDIAPDGRWAIHAWSSFGEVPKFDLVALPKYKKVRVLEANKKVRKRLARLETGGSEFFRVDIGDGVQLDAWCIKPPEFGPSKKYPLLVYVYGEPMGQTVVDRWGGKNYLWHLMLAQRGYLVMSFDSRGTHAPRGRAWRKAAFHKIGILSPADQAAAVKRVLADRPYVDPKRVAVWGWSGGGSSSLNAIFKYPKLYRLAMAVAPVANQRYYDTIYQERYMGLPGDNVEGFIQGSPINFAHQLEGDLLIVHGTGDDNCHYQATEMLIDELIRCNKQFTMMAYPNRTHAIREGANTTRHLRELLTRFLTEHMPPGPKKGS